MAICHRSFLLPGTGMADSIFIHLDHYVTITPGEPFRLFPFGVIHKNGKRMEIDADVARSIKLPHFKPPIKLGSHKDETPAGGFIKALEVRPDGLYAVPEWNEAGLRALNEGAYRYHSPEIIWEGAIEDSVTGTKTEGNIVVGAALTHIPALGQAAAFFETTVETKGENGMSDTVTMPASWLDRILNREPEGKQEPPQQPQGGDREDFAAMAEEFKATAEKFKADFEAAQAKIEKLETERAHSARVAKFAAQLEETNLKDDSEFAETLAELEDEQAEAIVQRVKALSAQADSTLEKDLGAADGGGTDNLQAFEALVQEKMNGGMSRAKAYEAVIAEKPDLYGKAVTNG